MRYSIIYTFKFTLTFAENKKSSAKITHFCWEKENEPWHRNLICRFYTFSSNIYVLWRFYQYFTFSPFTNYPWGKGVMEITWYWLCGSNAVQLHISSYFEVNLFFIVFIYHSMYIISGMRIRRYFPLSWRKKSGSDSLSDLKSKWRKT